MCGRFALFSAATLLEAQFEAAFDAEAPAPRYNIAPGSPLLAVRMGPTGERTFVRLHWGLIPSWAKDRKIGFHTINARAETVAEKPAFRAAFRRRRCLIPADGFYEWSPTPNGKQPYFIGRVDRQPLAFAGLWEAWTDPVSGALLESATLLVTEANARVSPIHDRMPVILVPTDYSVWLDPTLNQPEPLQALLEPCDPALLCAYPVARRVNAATQEGPALIEPLGEAPRLD